MPKVITGAGFQEFVATGKHETIAAEEKKQAKGNVAEPLEVKKETPVAEIDGNKFPEEVKESEDGLEQSERDFADTLIEKREHFRKIVGKKHKAMKEAQEAAADAEAFAKSQFEERRLVENERDRLKQELEAERKTKAAPKEPELKQPTKEDSKYQVNGQFDWDTYTNDVAEFKVKKAFAEDKVKRDEEAQKAAQDREASERAEAAKKFKEKADKIDGFQEKLAGSQVWFPNAVLEYITESEDGPEIVLALLDDPATADRISKLRPIKAIAEIGKLQKTLGQAKAVTPAAKPVVEERGGAPPPITPISSSSSGTFEADATKHKFVSTGDPEGFRRLREQHRAEERAKRSRH